MNIRKQALKVLLLAALLTAALPAQASLSVCFWPIVDAIKKAGEYIDTINGKEDLSSHAGWHPINEKQGIFLHHYFAKKNELNGFSDRELRSWASPDHGYLNKILIDNGFSIQLRPFGGKDSFGVVSILDVMVEWLHEGFATSVAVGGKEYPAVSIEEGFIIQVSSRHEHPVVAIQTKSGDTLYITVADKLRSEFELLEYVEKIQATLREYDPNKDGYATFLEHHRYNKIIFPMVNLDREEDISWLLGMNKGLWNIGQALQQTKFKMNEKGARVESAVALGVNTCPMPWPLTIDKPFFLWISRPGCTAPIFAGYITETEWKKP